MPLPPPSVAQWLKKTYPKPTVDPEWLEGCYNWIQEELNLDPVHNMPDIIETVNTQLLESDFADSMVAGTGFPHNALGAVHAVIEGPILVEIVDIMDIGHSAYSLQQVYESRVEYRKQAEIRDASGDEEQRKPMPKYPRSMLQFQLSDGNSVLPAIEFKSLPQFELGETPLGCKMMIKNVTIRRGQAHLEPRCVEVKGHRTADRDEKREETFLRALKIRLGEEVPEELSAAEAEPAPAPQPVPPVAQPPRPRAAAPAAASAPVRIPATPPARPAEERHSPARSSRSPLHEIAVPSEPKAGPFNALPMNAVEHADDEGEPRRRRIPSRANRSPSREPPLRARDRSRYFASPDDLSGSASSSTAPSSAKITLRGPGTEAAMDEIRRKMGLSPPHRANDKIPSSDEEDLYAIAPAAARKATTSGGAGSTAKQDPKLKSNQKAPASLAAEPSSDDFGPDEFELNEEVLQAIDQAEQQAYQNGGGSGSGSGSSQSQSQMKVQVQTQTQTKVKTEASSQAASATLTVASGPSRMVAPRSTPGMGSGPASRATSVPGTSSSGSKGRTGNDMSIITISDDEEDIEKENMPIPTRRTRRRIEPRAREDIIELSD